MQHSNLLFFIRIKSHTAQQALQSKATYHYINNQEASAEDVDFLNTNILITLISNQTRADFHVFIWISIFRYFDNVGVGRLLFVDLQPANPGM